MLMRSRVCEVVAMMLSQLNTSPMLRGTKYLLSLGKDFWGKDGVPAWEVLDAALREAVLKFADDCNIKSAVELYVEQYNVTKGSLLAPIIEIVMGTKVMSYETATNENQALFNKNVAPLKAKH